MTKVSHRISRISTPQSWESKISRKWKLDDLSVLSFYLFKKYILVLEGCKRLRLGWRCAWNWWRLCNNRILPTSFPHTALCLHQENEALCALHTPTQWLEFYILRVRYNILGIGNYLPCHYKQRFFQGQLLREELHLWGTFYIVIENWNAGNP